MQSSKKMAKYYTAIVMEDILKIITRYTFP